MKVAFLLSIVLAFSGCTKVNIQFEENDTTEDPAISFLDNYKVDISTYVTDSFATSGGKIFVLGKHRDPIFPSMNSGAFVEVSIPSSNPVEDKEVVFDSITMELTPTGEFYGDSTASLHFSIFEVSQEIRNEDESEYNIYYPRSFEVFPTPLAKVYLTDIRPNRKKKIEIRLPDALGREWLNKLKRGEEEVTEQTKFRSYFRGLYLQSDSSQNSSIFGFSGDQSALIRIHYRERGLILEEKSVLFGFVPEKQFNHIDFKRQGTVFDNFPLFKRKEIVSSEMSNRAYISSNIPSAMIVKFPDILQIKEISSYYKIIKAELVLTPEKNTYRYPYSLPASLDIRITDENYRLLNQLADFTGSYQNGSLNFPVTGEPSYVFNVTSFIELLIQEGEFTNKALMITATAPNAYSSFKRLVVRSQILESGVKLKLYVLRL